MVAGLLLLAEASWSCLVAWSHLSGRKHPPLRYQHATNAWLVVARLKSIHYLDYVMLW